MFNNIHGYHLEGHKHISINEPIQNYLDPDFVYFPIKLDNAVYTPLVSVGDSVLMGQPILNREGRFSHPVCSSVSGKVVSIKKMWHSSGKIVEMLEIENDHLENKMFLNKLSEESSRDEFVDLVKNAGIVGLGGAGFPTYVKYLPVQPAELIIINAAECEPYITCDYMSIIESADKVIRGLSYIMKYNGAKKGVIAIKKNKKPAIEALNKAIGDRTDISVLLLKDCYPAGWEKYIVEKATKKTYSALPRDVGAIVNNVQTSIAVCDAVEQSLPLTERVVTITGEGIKNPSNFRIKIGTKVTPLIEKCGGYVEDLGDAYFIAGGPMTGKSIFFDELILTSTVGSVIVKKKSAPERNPNCIGCGKCAENCPSFLTPTAIRQAFLSGNTNELAALNVNKCVQCGMCSYICPSRIEMTEYMGKAKELLAKVNSVRK